MSQELQAVYEQVNRFLFDANEKYQELAQSTIDYIEEERNARGEANSILANAKRSARMYVAAGVLFSAIVGAAGGGAVYWSIHRVNNALDDLHSARVDIEAARSANSELQELYGAKIGAIKSGSKYIELGDGWKFGACSNNGKPQDNCRFIIPD